MLFRYFRACLAFIDVFDLLSIPIPPKNLQTYRPFSSQACKGKEHCGINQTIHMNEYMRDDSDLTSYSYGRAGCYNNNNSWNVACLFGRTHTPGVIVMAFTL